MKNTLIINLFGSPGVGKTTTSAEIFAELKKRGKSCELVTEFAKMAVWENRADVMSNEIYMFAKKHHNIKVLEGKVDYIVLDSPLLMTNIYNDRYGKVPALNDLAASEFSRFNNFNIFLRRDRTEEDFEKEGRLQTLEEALSIEQDVRFLFSNLSHPKIVLTINEPEDISIPDLVDIIVRHKSIIDEEGGNNER